MQYKLKFRYLEALITIFIETVKFLWKFIRNLGTHKKTLNFKKIDIYHDFQNIFFSILVFGADSKNVWNILWK